jgi:hypothetical protein
MAPDFGTGRESLKYMTYGILCLRGSIVNKEKIMSIKAIETVYNGYRFRSRLEARWAVFFDTLGIKYEYEKEGFDLDGMWYLPDFWLPEQECYVEIKGQTPTVEEREKALRLAQLSCHRIYMFESNFCLQNEDGFPVAAAPYFPSHKTIDRFHLSPKMSWCHCGGCGRWIIKHNELAYDLRFRHWVPGYCEESGVCETYCPISSRAQYLWFEAPHLIKAYTAARQARFEYKNK